MMEGSIITIRCYPGEDTDTFIHNHIKEIRT